MPASALLGVRRFWCLLFAEWLLAARHTHGPEYHDKLRSSAKHSRFLTLKIIVPGPASEPVLCSVSTCLLRLGVFTPLPCDGNCRPLLVPPWLQSDFQEGHPRKLGIIRLGSPIWDPLWSQSVRFWPGGEVRCLTPSPITTPGPPIDHVFWL